MDTSTAVNIPHSQRKAARTPLATFVLAASRATTVPAKVLAAAFLLAGVIHAGVACSTPGPTDGPSGNASSITVVTQDAGRDEPLAPRFAVAGTDRSADPLDDAAQATPIGPQYTISQHVTLGGTLTHSDSSDFETNREPGRYVFGLRITF